MAGEAKDTGHGGGSGVANLPVVPMRRWEDWERSRLRKLRREERRRRDFERSHPSGYITGDRDFLVAPDTRSMYTGSQYEGSDTMSLNSSDDDHWGAQIGGYNEHNAQYPPPPVALINPPNVTNAKTVDASELEAMLEMGFDDGKSTANSSFVTRYQLNDGSSAQLPVVSGNGYSPLARSGSPGSHVNLNNTLSPTSPTIPLSGRPPRSVTGTPNRSPPNSTDGYGPLGPLDPKANSKF